jgi:hypothetical protein
MVTRKGELSKRAVETGWPYQVALPADACTGTQYDVVHDYCRGLSFARAGTTSGGMTLATTFSALPKKLTLKCFERRSVAKWLSRNARAKWAMPLAALKWSRQRSEGAFTSLLFSTERRAGARITFLVHWEFVTLRAFAEQCSNGPETFVQVSDAPKIVNPT